MHHFIQELNSEVPEAVREAAYVSFRNAEPDRFIIGTWIRRFLETAYEGALK
jgi:hypothetical protein